MQPRTLTIRFPRDHPGPWPGDVLESNGGTHYMILSMHRVKHRDPQPVDQAYRCTCEVLDYHPLDVLIHPFVWDSRGRVQDRTPLVRKP